MHATSIMRNEYHVSIVGLLIIAMIFGPVSGTGQEPTGWQMLENGGFIVLIRHALAPGGGDPPNFNLDDCKTQRNLSDAGRRQAQVLGDEFRSRQIPIEKVYSSQWCRCKETAQLAFGTYEELPALNSFFASPDHEGRQAETIRDFLLHRPAHRGNLILVTHQVNITALTNVFPSQGEIIIATLKNDMGLEFKARIRVNTMQTP